MRKSCSATIGLALVFAVAAPAAAQPVARCPANGTALQVSVGGFKERTGTLRVLTFAGEANYSNGRPRVSVIEVPVTRGSGPVHVCVPLPRAGDYAVSVRHDVNGNGRSDRSDGGGFSGNPRLSVGLAISRRNPDYADTRQSVAAGQVVHVPIILNYLQGLSIGPIRSAR